MADAIKGTGGAVPQQVSQATGQQSSIIDRGTEVAQVLFETRDESGLSDKAFTVMQKDWGRFVQACNGNPPPPLPMEEANNDFMDYIAYMRKHGDKVTIGSTGSNMNEIVSSNMEKARANAKGNNFYFAVNLAHGLAQDERIPHDYGFLRQPAEEFMTSAEAFLQTKSQ